MRFALGHAGRSEGWQDRASKRVPPSDGLCQCGCGGKTEIARKTETSRGWVKGQPKHFIVGHNARVTNHPFRTISSDDWKIEDRGYETPCWIWQSTAKVNGRSDHRRVGFDGGYDSAHRAVYSLLVGPIPPESHLHHLCLQEACVRPEHLRPLTPAQHRRVHAKLSDRDVLAIREDARPLRVIAEEYGVAYSYVCSVRSGAIRKDAS